MRRSSRLFRLVIDTNLVLSALVFANGRLAPLRYAWQSARCQPLISAVTAAELMRVLAYPKFKLSPIEQQELLADYLPYCATVRMLTKSPATPDCRDPNDLPFLHLVVVGKADALVSGDKDLLDLDGRFICPIVTADAWLSMVGLS